MFEVLQFSVIVILIVCCLYHARVFSGRISVSVCPLCAQYL